MIKKTELSLKELGNLAKIIPGNEPKLELAINRIPVDETAGIIPVCEPKLDGNEEKYLIECVRTNWISSIGKFIRQFEDLFSNKCGCEYGVACTNGTTALHLAMATLGIGPGDEVIIPTFTMIATINAITYVGAKAVLVDSEMDTWNIDISQIESKITKKTKAIMVVHTYGHPVDMDKINKIAKKHGLYVVEDAAEAHGALYKKKHIGSLSDVACFSFYGNKIITTGEGGMLTTNNKQIAEIARNLRDHAFSKERHFWHQYLGYNFRMTNMQAAIGLAQTEKMDEMVKIKRENAYYYTSFLKKIPGIITPPEKKWVKNVFWMYGILLEDEFCMTRDEFRQRLAKHGIETRTFFIPMHLQPIYYKMYKGQKYPNAEELCNRGLYLPSSAKLTKDDIKYIVNVIKNIKK
jgi:perosamine synthetase